MGLLAGPEVDAPQRRPRVGLRRIHHQKLAVVRRPVCDAPVALDLGDEPGTRRIGGIHHPQIAIGAAVAAAPRRLEGDETRTMRPRRQPVARLAIGQDRGFLCREIETKELHRFAAARRVLVKDDIRAIWGIPGPGISRGDASRSNAGTRRKERQLLAVHSWSGHRMDLKGIPVERRGDEHFAPSRVPIEKNGSP